MWRVAAPRTPRAIPYSALRYGRGGPVVVSVADMFEPRGALTRVGGFRHGQVGEQLVRRGAMPMAGVRRYHRRVARPQFLYVLTLELHAAGAGQTIERLTHWMAVPRGATAWRERNDRGAHARAALAGNDLIREHDAGKIGRRLILGGALGCAQHCHGFPPS